LLLSRPRATECSKHRLRRSAAKEFSIKELEEALLEESIDLAVHSVKDIPTDTPSRLMFPAVCRRDDVRDCWLARRLQVSGRGACGDEQSARQAQVLHIRPDLDFRDLRGNVDTRLRKVESGEYDAILLAKAGLDRLGVSQPDFGNPFARRFACRQWVKVPLQWNAG